LLRLQPDTHVLITTSAGRSGPAAPRRRPGSLPLCVNEASRRKPMRPGRHSAALALEPDEPAEAVTVDDLPIGCAPRPLLQVVQDPATLAETGKPGAQSRGIGGAQQGQHQAFAAQWPLIPGHVGAE